MAKIVVTLIESIKRRFQTPRPKWTAEYDPHHEAIVEFMLLPSDVTDKMTLDEILAYTDMDEREKEEVRSDTKFGRLRAIGYFGIDGRGSEALVRESLRLNTRRSRANKLR